jgi:hypothetical protein
LRIFKVHVEGAQSVSVGCREQAIEYARQCGATHYDIEEKMPNVLHGTAAQVSGELDTLHRRNGIEEFIIDTPAIGRTARLASIEQLARPASRLMLTNKDLNRDMNQDFS